jgi:cell division protein FtsB
MMSSTTYHASDEDSARQPNRRRWYPDDIRPPQSIDEADIALRLIDDMIASCSRRIDRYRVDGGETGHVEGLRAAWESKRIEIAYMSERLRAGETINADAVTKARAAELAHENASLRQSVARLAQRAEFLEKQSREYGVMSKGVNPAHVNSLQRQNEALVAKNARLVSQIEETKGVRAPTADASLDDAKARLKKSMHDTYAFALEALEEIAATGATLPPIARLLMEQAADSMPCGHRTVWRAKDLAFKREAAEAKYGTAAK